MCGEMEWKVHVVGGIASKDVQRRDATHISTCRTPCSLYLRPLHLQSLTAGTPDHVAYAETIGTALASPALWSSWLARLFLLGAPLPKDLDQIGHLPPPPSNDIF